MLCVIGLCLLQPQGASLMCIDEEATEVDWREQTEMYYLLTINNSPKGGLSICKLVGRLKAHRSRGGTSCLCQGNGGAYSVDRSRHCHYHGCLYVPNPLLSALLSNTKSHPQPAFATISITQTSLRAHNQCLLATNYPFFLSLYMCRWTVQKVIPFRLNEAVGKNDKNNKYLFI